MSKRISLVASVVVGLVGVTERVGSADTFDPISMDRLTPASTIGVDLGFVVWDEGPNTDLTTMGLNVAGHYVDPGSGFGGYLTLPLSYIDISVVIPPFIDINDSELAVGNIEAGGMFAKAFGSWSLVAHAGLALPTADDDGAGAYQALASVPRYGDIVDRIPNTTWLRLGVSPMGQQGKLFWRADLGLDFVLDEDDGFDAASPVLRLNVGGGFDLGSAVLVLELVTDVFDDNIDNDDDSGTVLTLGARFGTGKVRPGVGLLLPLGFDEQFDWDFAIAGSIAARL